MTLMQTDTIRILVGSNNPVKINAARQTVAQLFPDATIECEGMHAPSLVADQPMTAEETRQGAINRALYCRNQVKEAGKEKADFYMAMEGGVDCFEDGPATFAYVAILDSERQSVGCSAHLPLPPAVYNALQNGEELGHVMDRLFHTDNIKQKGGAIGLLTKHQATRESTYTQALLLAMVPFINKELWEQE